MNWPQAVGISLLSSIGTLLFGWLAFRTFVAPRLEERLKRDLESAGHKLAEEVEARLTALIPEAAAQIEEGVRDGVEQALRAAARGDLAREAGKSVVETAAETLREGLDILRRRPK